jgi:hypothetical protein
LAETPEDFLAEPRIAGAGQVHVAAVVADLFQLLGGAVAPEEVRSFVSDLAQRGRNRLAVTLLLCWLLSDEWFRQLRPAAPQVVNLLREGAAALSGQQASRKYVSDPDRREEMVRLALARLGCRPEGETVAQAQDRLTSLSSAERARVMRATREAEARARAIREALTRKAAEESADKWTRE